MMISFLLVAATVVATEIRQPILFHTPEADAILPTLLVFPADNPWNADITAWPLYLHSQATIASMNTNKPLRYNTDMGFVLVPSDLPRAPVKITAYPEEFNPCPFLLPVNIPIEGWPLLYKDQTLDAVQRDARNLGGDQHGIVVDPINRTLDEFYALKKTPTGCQAAHAFVFDLKTHDLCRAGRSSADAAGLPIFPAMVRYDNFPCDIFNHAMRVTVRPTRCVYVAPARHYASRLTDTDWHGMGECIRLRQDHDVSSFSLPVQAILKGLKKHGMFDADNGIKWAILLAPDSRISVLRSEPRRVTGSAFEVVILSPP